MHLAKRKSVIVAFPSNGHGGCEEYALTIARAMDQQGYAVHTLFPKSEGTLSLRKSFAEFELSYTPLLLRYWLPGRFRRIRFIWDIFKIVILLLKLKPSAVHISLPWPNTATELLIACAIVRIRTVVTFQLVGENFTLSSKIKGWYLWALSRNQDWIAVSENNRNLLNKVFGLHSQKIHLIYNGVTISKSKIQPSQLREISAHTPYILTVGRLSYQKGLDILLKAFANLGPMFSNFQIIILGDGELRDELKELATQLKISEKIFFKGIRSDVPDWLSLAALFVFPSRSEGQPFALLEAMAAGLPIIASNASSIPDLITHGREGLIFEKDNISDLTVKLTWVLSNLEQMDTFGTNALEKAKQFSQHTMIRQTLELLHLSPNSES